jgi:hypothetical protein
VVRDEGRDACVGGCGALFHPLLGCPYRQRAIPPSHVRGARLVRGAARRRAGRLRSFIWEWKRLLAPTEQGSRAKCEVFVPALI